MGSAPRTLSWLATAFCFLFPPLHHMGPIIGNWGTALLGATGDTIHGVWMTWHYRQSVFLAGEPLFWTDRLMAPVGTTLHYAGSCLVPSVLVAPVTAWAGAPAGYHTALVLLTLLAGLGPFLLVRRLTGSVPAARFAAFAAAMSPAFAQRIEEGHYTLLSMGCLPVAVWLFLREIVQPRRPWAGSATLVAGFMGLVFLTDYYMLIYCVLIFAALALGLGASRAASRDWPGLADLARRGGAAAALFAAGFYVFTLATPFQNAMMWNDSNPHPWAGRELGIDPAYLFAPRAESWWLAGWFGLKAPSPALNPERLNYLGWFAMALAGVGTVALWRRSRWLAATLAVLSGITFLLSLGAVPQFAGKPFTVPAPWDRLLLYQSWRNVPILSQARTPGRWILVADMAFITAAGAGFAALHRRMAGWRAPAFMSAALLAVMFEYGHRPIRTVAVNYPAAYAAHIAPPATPLDMIVETPIGLAWGTGSVGPRDTPVMRMVWATRHGYRTVSAYLGKLSAERIARLRAEPFMAELFRLQDEPPAEPAVTEADRVRVRDWVRANHLCYVVVDKNSREAATRRYLDALGFLAVSGEDASHAIYAVQLP